jgi:tetratricopeptide (TPR) repeat protein
MKLCKIADSHDWQEPEFQASASLLQLQPSKTRNSWEAIQVYAGLQQLGLLKGTSRALGLGTALDGPLTEALAQTCQAVTVDDLDLSAQGPIAAIADESFDFVWNCGAIAQTDNFQDLHRLYKEMHRILKPGGIAALTTEFNLSDQPSYEPNRLWVDRNWMRQWFTDEAALVQGLELIEPLDWSIADEPENQPRLRRAASIQCYANDVILSSIAFFLRKQGEFSQPYQESWLGNFWSSYLAACDRQRTQDFRGAEALLRQILTEADLPDRLRLRTLRRLADALYAQGKKEEVKAVCLEAMPYCKGGNEEDHLMLLALHCKQLRLTDEAAKIFSRVVELPSTPIEMLILANIHRAEGLRQQGYFQPALDLLATSEAQLPANESGDALKLKLWFQRASCLEQLGQIEEAIVLYESILKATPGPDAQLQAVCYRRLSACMQIQMNQLNTELHQLKQSGLFKLYKKWNAFKRRFQKS